MEIKIGVVLVQLGGKEMNLYIIGRMSIKGYWEIVGVFDDEIEAVSHCLSEDYFVGPITLNEVAPEETTTWPGAYRPLANVQAT